MGWIQLVLLGQIFGMAFASGLNLYATVAILGIGSRLGWTPDLPHALQGLENPVIITTALALYLVEFVVDKLPHADSLWDAVHTLIRPTAAALLTFAALETLPLATRVGCAAFAGAVALAAHGIKAGLRLSLNARSARASAPALSLGEDISAVALVLLTLSSPEAALVVAAASVAVTTVAGPRLWRAFMLGYRALDARLRGFFGHSGWKAAEQVAPDLRRLLDPTPLGLAPPRAARAALVGMRGVGAYRNGWLVVHHGRPAFLYRSWFRPRRVAIAVSPAAGARAGPWVDVIEPAAEGCTLLLLKDGPGADAALAAMELPAPPVAAAL